MPLRNKTVFSSFSHCKSKRFNFQLQIKPLKNIS
nr:MAG TPA: hypothetical protein [Caudoviricetes sp.]DAV59472.1 MAG TPA: hypothetical protein [Caudoviricetes sp.]